MSIKYSEKAVSCLLDGQPIYGLFTVPETNCHTAVVIVVGGPQYRVGSHRQFVLLARHLASHGILALRFDYSGMGYSEGFPKRFYEIDADISGAIDLVQQQDADIKKIYLWGLCDAASAIAFFAHEDPRVNGIVLLNPWVRSEASHSKALLSNYYQDRFFNIEVWKDLIKSPKKMLMAVISLFNVIFKVVKSKFSRSNSNISIGITVEERVNDIAASMFKGLTKYSGKICFILSGNDLTAQEFEQVLASNGWLNQENSQTKTQIHRINDANHTFSSNRWRSQVEQITLDFVR